MKKKIMIIEQMALDFVIKFMPIQTQYYKQVMKYNGIICIDADSVFYKKIDGDWIRKTYSQR